MMLPRILLLATAVILSAPGPCGPAPASATPLTSGALIDLNGATVGQVTIERQGRHTFLHVRAAGKAAGATLELLVSTSDHPLMAGDHNGPGLAAVRVGRLEQAEVRSELPPSVRPAALRSVWVWCPSVRLPSARASLHRSLTRPARRAAVP